MCGDYPAGGEDGVTVLKYITGFAAAALMFMTVSVSFGQSPGAADGIALYEKYCSGCHGNIESTTKPGRRFKRIQSAIKYNIGGMNHLKGLKDEELMAIADALSMVEAPKDADGGKLYSLICASCHRPLEDTDIKGRSVDDIKAAMARQMCQTVNLRFLDDENIKKISDVLQGK